MTEFKNLNFYCKDFEAGNLLIIIYQTRCLFLFCSKTETELQELIKEVEDNPAPADAPQPPSPGDSGNGKRFSTTITKFTAGHQLLVHALQVKCVTRWLQTTLF